MKNKQPKTVDLTKFKKLWKTKKSLEQVEDKELWQEILKDYRPKTHKPQWSVTWKDLADRVFSEYVRLLDADERWMCKCVTCGRTMPWTEIQNWHFVTRWALKYRFEKCNCNCQCYTCNCILNWNYQKYTLYMIDKYGREFVEAMLSDKTIIEIKQYEYEEMIKNWYSEIQQLKTTKIPLDIHN